MAVLYSIILAGGSGSRLWPVSRETFPKQMFKLDNEYTLFQKTFLNVAGLIDDKNIITATNIKYVSSIKEQLKSIQEKFGRNIDYKIISEPVFRNTAPSIALTSKYINDKLNFNNESPIILTIPSDQLIIDRVDFLSIIEKGINLAKAGYIVSFGTETDNVNENFGYIKARKNENITQIEPSALKAVKFIEKPSKKDSKETLKGKIYKNSGIYMFNYETFSSELEKYAPEIYKIIAEQTIDNSIPSIPMTKYEEIPNISIDYALMEKTKKLVTIPIAEQWKDIGSWNSLYEILPKDEQNNSFIGKTIDIGSQDTMVYSTSKLIATMGLKDTIVVETEDAVLVCKNKDSNGVKKLYKKLNGKNATTKEVHKTMYRPWGYYTVLENGNGFLTKCITVNPNAKLSVQRHTHRSEHWIVLEGEATVQKGEEIFVLQSGESVDIEKQEIHSLQNQGKSQLKILEVQQGDILDENDIERLQDIYGRV